MKARNQVVPPNLLERVHEIMNFIHCFQQELKFRDYLNAEELYIALEDSFENKNLATLIDSLASLFVQAFLKDIEEKKQERDYLEYSQGTNIQRKLKECFRKQPGRFQILQQSWREILTFLCLTKPFRKNYLIKNTQNGEDEFDDQDNQEDLEEEVEREEEIEEEQKEQKEQKDEDIEEKEQSIQESEGNNSQAYKLSNEGYGHYTCKSIERVNIPFRQFQVQDKLEAFSILIKIGYRLAFTSAFYAKRFKEVMKEDLVKEALKHLEELLKEKEVNDNELVKIEEEISNFELNLGNLTDDEEMKYKREKTKRINVRKIIEKLEKTIEKAKAELILRRRKFFFQLNNWVCIGKDRNKNQFLVSVYEPLLLFKKKLVEYIDTDQGIKKQFEMLQYDSLNQLRESISMNYLHEELLWDKITQLKKDGVLEIENERNAQELIENFDRRKEIYDNLLSRQLNSFDDPIIPVSNQQKNKIQCEPKGNTVKQISNMEEIDQYSYDKYDKRITRSSAPGNKNRKKLIIDDDEDDDDYFENY